MRIFTCTPVSFDANEHFFGRDSGLLSRGLAALGHTSMAVMPGPARATDLPHVIRCSNQELRSVNWWKQQELDGVILYAWGDPAYIEVARAIHQAGIRMIQNLDTVGLPSPYADFSIWLKSRIGMLSLPTGIVQKARIAARSALDFFPMVYEKRRLAMIELGDAIATVSPAAHQSVVAYTKALGKEHLSERVHVLPHAVLPIMDYDGRDKENRVLVVGRWAKQDWAQKDPQQTIRVLKTFLESKADWECEIVGGYSDTLEGLTHTWDSSVRARLALSGRVSHQQLAQRYKRAKILFCGSRYESFHIASAESLCSGCSVVVGTHPLLASTAWFTTKDSGSLAMGMSHVALADALITEADMWENEMRDPDKIADGWKMHLHATNVAALAVSILGL